AYIDSFCELNHSIPCSSTALAPNFLAWGALGTEELGATPFLGLLNPLLEVATSLSLFPHDAIAPTNQKS
ncbi:hypothetical protein HAX54_037538, partial [Datura stramonium]|nr:hypothetical protein [Datura stramonium]